MLDEKSYSQVEQFILAEIDSVPHLEALLLIWNTRPKQWPVEEMASALYVSPEVASRVLADLTSRELIVQSKEPVNTYYYDSSSESRDVLLKNVDAAYRFKLLPVSALVHSKVSVTVRDFARAYGSKKD